MEIAFIVLGVLVLAGLVLMVAALWKIFQKAGYAGWESIVPIYNGIVFLKIIGKPAWWLLPLSCNFLAILAEELFTYSGLMSRLVPLALNVVFYVYMIWSFNILSKSFGKDEGFTAGLVFLGIVFFPMLGFGSAEYMGPYGNKALYEQYRQDKEGFDFEHNRLMS